MRHVIRMTYAIFLGSASLTSLAATRVDGNVLRVENAELKSYLKIEFLQEDLVRFEAGKKDMEPSAYKDSIWESPMIQKQNWQRPPLQSPEANLYLTTKLQVRIDPSQLCASVRDRVLDKELAHFCPKFLDKHWKQLQIHSYLNKNVYGLGQYFSDPGSSELGWIGKVWDPLPQTMGNALRPFSKGSNGYTMIPIAYVLGKNNENYGIFLDNIYKQMWSFQNRTWTAEMYGDQIRWYVLQGANLQELRKSYMNLVGHPPMPPVESFGLWISRFGFENWDQISEELSSLRQAQFPTEGFVLDLQWYGGRFFNSGDDLSTSKMGTLQFDHTHFPNPESTIRHFAESEGIQFMPIEQSYIGSSLSEHRDLASRNFLAVNCRDNSPTMIDHNPWWGKGGMLDWTNPSASRYWHDTKRQPLVNKGIRFHWTDLGEPEMYSDQSCYFGFPELQKREHADIHNIFNLKWAQSIRDGYRRNDVRERHFILSRSGTAGIQRYGAGMWSGDIGANMNALISHLKTQSDMSLSGIDYYGSDVGGFHRSASTLDGDQNELYTQWFANSALFDFPVRPHVWTYQQNKETSPARIGHLASNLANIRLRYELFPYYYTLAWNAHQQGTSIVSPMVYEFQADANIRSLGHQKMIGPYLMAAIVARYGEKERNVYLPKGTWVSWHTGEFFEGKDSYVNGIPTFYDGKFQIPLFIKSGAIIPMLDLSQQTRNLREALEANQRPFVVKIVPDFDRSSFAVYEDDYRTHAYQEGNYQLTKVEQEIRDDEVSITIHPTEGLEQSSERNYILKLLLPKRLIEKVTLNGQILEPCETHFHTSACWKQGSRNEISLFARNLPNSEKHFVLTLTPKAPIP